MTERVSRFVRNANSRTCRAHAGRENSPPEKATTFHHHRPTFALFHPPPTGSPAPLIEKLAELIKTPHPGRPAYIITLIQSLSVLRFPFLPFSRLSFPAFFLFDPLVSSSRGGIATLGPRISTSSPRDVFAIFVACHREN